MNLIIRKFSEEHLPLVDAFFCTETPIMLLEYNAKTRKRILKHSNEMEIFLKDEAYEEQEKGLNTTRLAVASDYQGNGIGKLLIQFSAYMGRKIKEMSGLAFITLDCYEHRVSFYESIGFVKNLIQPIVLPYDAPISMRLGLEEYFEKAESEIG